MEFTGMQQRFIDEYLDCLNATEAARRAGYKEPRRQGSRLLTNVDIAAAIQQGIAEKAMSADEVLARLAAIARADMRDVLVFEQDTDTGHWSWSLRLTPEMPLHLVKSITPNRYGYRIELHDAQAALTTLARHHGLLNTFDWSNVPDAIVEALGSGKLTVDDLKRLATPSTD